MKCVFLFLLFSTALHEERIRNVLKPEQYRVMREKGTEKAYAGKYVTTSIKGVYTCFLCNNPLFSSKDKIFLGSGWPLFSKPIEKKRVYYLEDWELGFKRYEVRCRNCDSHLGHIFKEKDAYLYTINSCALDLKEQ